MPADSACLRVQNQKAALKTHGVTAFTADQLAERDAEIRGAGYEEGVQDGIEATIAAQEEDMGKACVSKVVMGYGGGASIAAQQRLARFKHTFTFQDMRQTRIQTGKENEILRSSAAAASAAVSNAEKQRVAAILEDETLERVLETTLERYQLDEGSADVIMQAGVPELPFGGVGASGMGRYHGRSGFDTFSHDKAVLRRPFRFDFKLRYPPYGLDLNLLRRLAG